MLYNFVGGISVSVKPVTSNRQQVTPTGLITVTLSGISSVCPVSCDFYPKHLFIGQRDFMFSGPF